MEGAASLGRGGGSWLDKAALWRWKREAAAGFSGLREEGLSGNPHSRASSSASSQGDLSRPARVLQVGAIGSLPCWGIGFAWAHRARAWLRMPAIAVGGWRKQLRGGLPVIAILTEPF